MKAKIIIIPPDGAKISDYFEYGLTDDLNHNDVYTNTAFKIDWNIMT